MISMTMREHLVQLLGWTLDPQLTREATCSLDIMKRQRGFLRELVLISEDALIPFGIRFSAMVYLKNSIEQNLKNSQTQSYALNKEDFEQVKHSLLEVLIRLMGKNETKLLSTFKQIVFLLVKHEYKTGKWEGLIPTLISYIDECPDEQTVKASLLVTKILFQILGKSLTEEVKLNNVANKLILPLVNLASKMYSSLSTFTCQQLIQIFKIFTQAIEFHLPEMVQNNIHVFMVLVKNVLDLKVNYQGGLINEDGGLQRVLWILRVKKQGIRFLQKMYQRHSTSNLLSLRDFVREFNEKYTKSFLQTIVGIIMQKTTSIHENNMDSNHFEITIQKLNYELGNHALGIFSFIASNKQSGKFIFDELEKYQIKIIYLSIEKYLHYRWHNLDKHINLPQNNSSHDKIIEKNSQEPTSERNGRKMRKLFSNYTDFVQTVNEQRLALRLFLCTIMGNKNIPNRKRHIDQILQILVTCIIDGSLKQKQLALYLLASLERQIQLLTQQQGIADDIKQPIAFILKAYVFPLLTPTYQQHTVNLSDNLYLSMVRLRAYSVYAAFQYLQLGKQHSIQLCEHIYSQLCRPINNQLQQFVKVQCIQTFNMILSQHEQLVPLLEGQVKNILIIYTQLLQQQFEVMRFYDEILSLFSPYITDIVYELLDLLTTIYFRLNNNKTAKLNCLSANNYHYNQKTKINIKQNDKEQFITIEETRDYEGSQEDDDEFQGHKEEEDGSSDSNETVYEERNEKYDSVGTQCLGSIKKLLFKHNVHFNEQLISINERQRVERIADRVLLAAVHGLSSQDQCFIREGLCIINLLLYKGFVSKYYSGIFPIFMYPVLMNGNKNNHLGPNLFRQRIREYIKCGFSTKYHGEQIMLPQKQQYQQNQQNQSLMPLEELFECLYKKMLRTFLSQQEECLRVLQLTDCVGILKNTIKHFNKDLHSMKCPFSGKTYLQLIIDAVVQVFETGLSQRTYKCTEMVGVLAVFEAILENRVFYDEYSIDSESSFSRYLYLRQMIQSILRWNQHLHSSFQQQQGQSNQLNLRLKQNNDSQYDNEKITTTQQQQQLQSSLLQVTLLVTYYYPQQLIVFIQDQAHMFAQNSSNSLGNPHYRQDQNQLLIQFVNQHIIQKISQSLKQFPSLSLIQILQQPHLPPIFYIIIKSLYIFADTLVIKFALNDSKISDNTMIPADNLQFNKKGNYYTEVNKVNGLNNELSEQRRTLFSKIFLLISKLSIQICFISLKQALSDKFQQQLTTQQIQSIQETFNSIENYRIKSTHQTQNTNQDDYQSQNIMLAQMFSSLNLGYSPNYETINPNQKSTPSTQINNQSNYQNQKHQFEQRYQQHVNLSKHLSPQLLMEEFFSEDSDTDSSAQRENPFENFDEQYLLAYDSPTLKPLQEKNKKIKLLNILQDILEIHMNKNIFYLKDIFQQSCQKMH